jgi:simple sugar transport system ATP-binding protein
MSVMENAVLEHHGSEQFGSGLMLDYDRLRSFATGLIESFDIRPAGCEETHVGGLSGGNQQKVIIARGIAHKPQLIVAFAPTRGLDVGAIEFVHRTLIAERDRGAAILLVSFELDEVMDVSDTIAVIYHGRIVRTFAQGTVDEEQLGLLMAGGGTQ